MAKFRRLKTIMRKMVQTSNMCGKAMSLIVYDKKLNNVVEYFTEESVQLDHIHEELKRAENGEKRTRTNRLLTIRSVNANLKIKTDKDGTNKDNESGGNDLSEESEESLSKIEEMVPECDSLSV